MHTILTDKLSITLAHNALKVVLNTPHIQRYLLVTDPKAYSQVERARELLDAVLEADTEE